MKMMRIKLLPGLLLLLTTWLPVRAGVQATLHDFTGIPDGQNPGGLVMTNGVLYGVSSLGGNSNNGMLFSFTTNGNSFTDIHDFAGGTTDGAGPNDVLVNGATLYGTTANGGTNISGFGIVYKAGLTGNNYAILHSFTNTPDGQFPGGGLVLGGITLYGTTMSGGSNGFGTIFKMTTNGQNFAVLHNFTNTPDGSNPRGTLLLNNATLYGTTSSGGSNGFGTIYKINTNGTGFLVIHHFTNSPDGASPYAGLAQNGNLLFGTAPFGGNLPGGGGGVVFSLNTNGANYKVVHNFYGFSPTGSNIDGTFPFAPVIYSSGNLYGATFNGGAANGGTLFQTSTNGTTFTTLRNFTTSPDAASVRGTMFLNGTTLYGMSYNGGSIGDGLAFSLLLTPVITQQPQSVTVTNGNPATFTSAADGIGLLNYQWRFRTNTVIPGATNTTLVFTNCITNIVGTYSMVVTNNFGSITSSFASLTVITAPNLLAYSFNPADGSFSLALANIGKSTNRVWASTNLSTTNFWRVIATNVMATNGLWFFTDTNTGRTNGARFYRMSHP